MPENSEDYSSAIQLLPGPFIWPNLCIQDPEPNQTMGSSGSLPVQLCSTPCILSGFQRTFALGGTPPVIWIDAGLNTMKFGKDYMQSEVKVISELNLKFSEIEFRVTLPP